MWIIKGKVLSILLYILMVFEIDLVKFYAHASLSLIFHLKIHIRIGMRQLLMGHGIWVLHLLILLLITDVIKLYIGEVFILFKQICL